MSNPDGLLMPPVRAGRVLGWASASIVAAFCAGLLVAWAAWVSAGPAIEGTPVVMGWVLSLSFAIPGVVGGAVCVGWSGRVYNSRRGRAAALAVSWIALALSILSIMLGVIVVVLP